MSLYTLRLAILVTAAGAYLPCAAQEPFAEKPAYCEPGFQYIPVTEYREVSHACCKQVPIIRKKWVYSSKSDYFCVPKFPACSCDKQAGCPSSPECGSCNGPFCRQQLIKKRVEYQCGTKCEVEIVKDKVPCVVWRKVPCSQVGPPPGAPTTGSPPATSHPVLPSPK